ncbi:hypothetical protein F5X98DRAFT_385615 [Xylaria grammica]|nr:hypothetical protein F5X98DRAFT_385615 [Xylaria grammica]
MFSTKTPINPTLAKFWNVFLEELPRAPTVDELICRVVAINYPEGLVRDRYGAYIYPPRDAGAVTKQILFTLKTAIDLEAEFWRKSLRQNGVFTPLSWGVRLSANVAIIEAEAQILDALQYIGDIGKLDELFWAAFRRTEMLCEEAGYIITWPPFSET